MKAANHMSMYDGKNYIDEAVSKLAPFFQSSLGVTAKEELAAVARLRPKV